MRKQKDFWRLKTLLTELICVFGYSTHGGRINVLSIPLAKFRAPRKWSAWFPNLPAEHLQTMKKEDAKTQDFSGLVSGYLRQPSLGIRLCSLRSVPSLRLHNLRRLAAIGLMRTNETEELIRTHTRTVHDVSFWVFFKRCGQSGNK